MSSHGVMLLCLVFGTLVTLGCAEQAAPTPPTAAQTQTADAASQAESPNPPESSSAAADDPWRGLERHEIQLDQKLLVVKGSKGVIGCSYLNAAAFEKFGEALAIIPAADTAGMLDSKVTVATPKAKELGIEVGMPGREALDKIR